MFRSHSMSIWRGYKSYVEKVVQLTSKDREGDIAYWQKRLFSSAVTYALPLSLLALIPSIYLESQTGSLFIAGFEVIATATFASLALAPGLSLTLRKTLVTILVAVSSIVLAILFGEFSMVCIYLFSLSAFVALVYSNKIAYLGVVSNFLILGGFALAIRYQVFEMHLLMNVTFERWVIYSLNFVFMNLIVVVLITQILNGLLRTMRKKVWLFEELQKELEQSAFLNRHLKTSKAHYKTLFFQSPLPKMIFDMDTLMFLQVNLAATDVYGYTVQEFLAMKLTDLHPEDCIAEMFKQVYKDHTVEPLLPYITQHLGKNGRRIDIEVRRSSITYKGKNSRMITTTDITQRVKFIEAIQQQNEKLKEIAYIQSHVIRLPLSRIMSISELINIEHGEEINPELLNYLNVSTSELDSVIRDVVNKSEAVFSKKPDVSGLQSF